VLSAPSGKLADLPNEPQHNDAQTSMKKGWLALSLNKIVYPKLSGCLETGH
jgi:hypothetical protein